MCLNDYALTVTVVTMREHGTCKYSFNHNHSSQNNTSVLPSILKGYCPKYAFSTDLSLMWKWGRAKSFDVASGSTQGPPSKHAFPRDLGRTLHNTSLVPRPLPLFQ